MIESMLMACRSNAVPNELHRILFQTLTLGYFMIFNIQHVYRISDTAVGVPQRVRNEGGGRNVGATWTRIVDKNL